MYITKLKVSNFKSFNELCIEPGKFNVVVGANAAGKSNFIHIFEFLRDMDKNGLENAIQQQGGVEFLRNIGLTANNTFNLEIEVDCDGDKIFYFGEDRPMLVVRVTYSIQIIFLKTGGTYKTNKERLELKLEKYGKARDDVKGENEKEAKFKVDFGSVIITKNNEEITYKTKPKDFFETNLYFDGYIEHSHWENLTKQVWNTSLLVDVMFKSNFLSGFSLGSISIYDFDTKAPKMGTRITGKSELEDDGSNLAIVLRNIVNDKEKKKRFVALLNSCLPFVNDMSVKMSEDKTLLFNIKENYFKGKNIPAAFISDGTINITNILIALYFEKKNIAIFEEPESGIHPYLISKVVEIMKGASKDKQIFVTTHNPEFIKYVDKNDLFLVKRGDDGHSVMFKPEEDEMIAAFLENELGLGELFVQNLLV